MFRSQPRWSVLVSGFLALVFFATPAVAQQRGAPVAPPGPTAAQAMAALAAAQETAEALGVSLSCAVVDSRGDMIALARMDGARFYTTDVARGKARMSAMFGQPSGDMADFGNSLAFPELQRDDPGAALRVPGRPADQEKRRIDRGYGLQRRGITGGRRRCALRAFRLLDRPSDF